MASKGKGKGARPSVAPTSTSPGLPTFQPTTSRKTTTTQPPVASPPSARTPTAAPSQQAAASDSATTRTRSEFAVSYQIGILNGAALKLQQPESPQDTSDAATPFPTEYVDHLLLATRRMSGAVLIPTTATTMSQAGDDDPATRQRRRLTRLLRAHEEEEGATSVVTVDDLHIEPMECPSELASILPDLETMICEQVDATILLLRPASTSSSTTTSSSMSDTAPVTSDTLQQAIVRGDLQAQLDALPWTSTPDGENPYTPAPGVSSSGQPHQEWDTPRAADKPPLSTFPAAEEKIDELSKKIKSLQADNAAQLEQIKGQSVQIKDQAVQIKSLQAENASESVQIKSLQAENATQSEQIKDQSVQIKDLQAENAAQSDQIKDLKVKFDALVTVLGIYAVVTLSWQYA